MSCNNCGACSFCIRPINLFSNSSMRGVAGQELFAREVLHFLGSAIGAWAIDTYGPEAVILITHDTKISSPWIRACMETGLLCHPVYLINENVMPTGVAAHIMQRFKIDNLVISCALVITTEHISPKANGFTIIDGATGLPIDEEAQQAITNNYFELQEAYHTDQDDDEQASINHEPHGAHLFVPELTQQYVEDLLDEFPAAPFKKKKIVLDCQGTLNRYAPYMFELYDATVIKIDQESIQYPERLAAAVLDHEAAIGFAFNNDGTRLIAASSDGEIKDGDDLLAILMSYASAKTVVTTNMANQGLDAYAQQQGKELIRVTEDAFAVSMAVSELDHAQKTKHSALCVGATHAGHIVTSQHHYMPDAMLAALRICTILHKTKNWAFKTFEKFPRVTASIPVDFPWPLDDAPIADVIDAARRRFVTGRLFATYDPLEPKLHITSEHIHQQVAHQAAEDLALQLAAEFAKKKIQQQLNQVVTREPEAYS